ncbi:probable E3 ubiquitin-protein ligase EDA40 [Tanacetum coccineum]
MVFGWRKAFCTSIPPETDPSVTSNDGHDSSTSTTPKFSAKFSFFSSSSSNPSTPRVETDSGPNLRCRTTRAAKSASVPVSPKLHCKTSNSPKLFQWASTPSSPRSPSTFSLIKSNLRLSNNRCGLCLQSVKRGKGVALFTAECSHGFHFPCIAGHVRKNKSLTCPVCSTVWKQMPLLSVTNQNNTKEDDNNDIKTKLKKLPSFKPDLKVYDDDEPLGSLTPKGGFHPIPESDENCEDEFPGFRINGNCNGNGCVEVRLLPEIAVVSSGRSYETYAVVMRVKAPAVPEKIRNRAPIDLVTVIDVSGKMSSEKMQTMKRAMRLVISSLTPSDRLSIVAFSSCSKRLMPLKRMTTSGQRAARRIVEAMAVLEGSSNGNDAVKKAVKVLEDRRERNTVGSIVLISDVLDQSSRVVSTRVSDVAVHTLRLAACDDRTILKTVTSLITVPVHDLNLKLGFVSSSAPGEIAAVYSYLPRPIYLGSGQIRINEMYANEERELLVELKVPSSAVGAHTVLSVRCSYKESVTQEVINCKDHALVVPKVTAVRSSSHTIQRLRNLFVTTRALAESHRLAARNDLIESYHMLISARALLHQTSSASSEFVVSIEAELSDLQRRRQAQAQNATAAYIDEQGEPLTPTSAWRVAEKLAKVAIMRKSLNRVSDLHGFEDARF